MRSSIRTLPVRTYFCTSVGIDCSSNSRQNGHCMSTKETSRTGASALPTKMPFCGSPA